MFAYLGVNHKLSYKYAFWICTVFTLIVTLVATTVVTINRIINTNDITLKGVIDYGKL